MTQQNMNSLDSSDQKKKAQTTDTAYGDPVITSSPTINDEHTQADLSIPESTQYDVGSSVMGNANTKKKDPTTYTAYGDPLQ